MLLLPVVAFFFFNDTATTEIYTLSLHDALPIYRSAAGRLCGFVPTRARPIAPAPSGRRRAPAARSRRRNTVGRSEEHTSELQSQSNLVCRLLLEKKNNTEAHRAQSRPATTSLTC